MSDYDAACAADDIALTDFVAYGRPHPAVAVLTRLLKFRWNRNLSSDRVSCRSCGALATENFDEHGPRYSRIDQCSPSCPWRQAEELTGGL